MTGLVPENPYVGFLWTAGFLGCTFILVLAQEQLLRLLRTTPQLGWALYPVTVLKEWVIAPISTRLVDRGRQIAHVLPPRDAQASTPK
jgi:hypothetical protein